jgi:TRAP-type C4-dicarboxylate transport system permease small subunit
MENISKKKIFFFLLLLFLLVVPVIASYAKWDLEIDIPVDGATDTIPGYVNKIYKFVVTVIGILGAGMFMIGGFQYLVSAGNTSSVGHAKETIFAALAGLIIVFASFLLLRIINKELTDLSNPTTLKESSYFLALLP